MVWLKTKAYIHYSNRIKHIYTYKCFTGGMDLALNVCGDTMPTGSPPFVHVIISSKENFAVIITFSRWLLWIIDTYYCVTDECNQPGGFYGKHKAGNYWDQKNTSAAAMMKVNERQETKWRRSVWGGGGGTRCAEETSRRCGLIDFLMLLLTDVAKANRGGGV